MAGVAKSLLTVVSERTRTPNDLLNRALAHINYRAFDVGRLKIFEDPAVVVFKLYPRAANENFAPSRWARVRQRFSNREQGLLLSVKVISLDRTKQKFAVRYAINNIAKLKAKQQNVSALEALPEALIAEMFGSIPDVSLRKVSR